MATALEFNINLSGNFATALNGANHSLGETEKGTKRAKKELELFEGEIGSLKGELGGLGFNLSALAKGGSFFTFDLAEGIKSAIELVHKLVETFVDLGKEMVQTAGKTEDLNLAIELDVGKERAENINKLTESLQEQTRFSGAQLKGALLPLLEQGLIADDQLTDVTAAATDLAARRNKGIEGVSAALGAFQDIAINPQRMRGALKELQIRQVDYFKDLGQLMGVTADQAKALTEKGRVQTKTLISVALNQIQQRQGGSLGSPTTAAAQTLGGTLQRLSNLKENLFERLAGSPGMKKVQEFLDRIIDELGGPKGTALMNRVGDGFSYMFSGLVKAIPYVVDFFSALPGYIDKVLDGAKLLGESALVVGLVALPALLPAIAAGFVALVPEIVAAGIAFAAAAAPFLAVGAAIGSVALAIDRVSAALRELGGVKRVWQDFKDWIGGDNDSGVSNGAVNQFSPEWKRANQPQQAGGIPMMASGGIVNRPTMAIIGEAGPEAVVPLSKMSGRGGGSITFSPVFQLNSNGSPDDSRALLEQAEQNVRIFFKKILDEADATFGFAQPSTSQRDAT